MTVSWRTSRRAPPLLSAVLASTLSLAAATAGARTRLPPWLAPDDERAPRPAGGAACPRCTCPERPACPDVEAPLATARPWAVALETGGGIGLFFATYGLVNVAVARQLWQRLEVEAAFRVAAGKHLLGLAAAGKTGVLLHAHRRIDVLLFWRLGYVHFSARLPTSSVAVDTLLLSFGVEVKLPLARAWELRLAPIVGTAYWRELWGFVLEPTVGVAYRF